MSESEYPVFGVWFRASDYVIEGVGMGQLIRAAPDATVEAYDPWVERSGERHLQRSRSRAGRSNEPPYALLANLLDDVPELLDATGIAGLGSGNPTPTLSADASKALLDWIRRYGLLGLTLHEVRAVTFPSRYARYEEFEAFYPSVRKMVWGAGGWSESRSTHLGNKSYAPAPGEEIGPPLEPREYPPDWPQPGIERRREGIADDWGPDDFRQWRLAFGDPDRLYEYPRPSDGLFWHDYRESVSSLLHAAWALRDVLRAAEEHKRQPRPDAARDAALFFNPLIDRVHPVLRPQVDGGWGTAYAAPSLLSILALMARDDLADGSLHRCARPDCGRLFRSTARAVSYCSRTCQSTEQKRGQARRARGGTGSR